MAKVSDLMVQALKLYGKTTLQQEINDVKHSIELGLFKEIRPELHEAYVSHLKLLEAALAKIEEEQ